MEEIQDENDMKSLGINNDEDELANPDEEKLLKDDGAVKSKLPQKVDKNA